MPGNFHPYLKNVRFEDTDVYRDDLVNRYQHASAGAFSYHMGKKWYTTREVQAGEELFDDYDESWFFDDQVGGWLGCFLYKPRLSLIHLSLSVAGRRGKGYSAI